MWKFHSAPSLGYARRVLRPSSAATLWLLACAVSCRDTVAPPVASTMTAVSPTTLNAIAGQPVAQPPTVILRDATGAPIGGITVVFSDSALASTPYITTTGPDGTASFAWVGSTHAGVDRLTALAQGLADVDFTATVQAASPARVTVESDLEQIGEAGSTLPSAPTIAVNDLYGNATPGYTVTFALDGPGGASIAHLAVLTDAKGYASAGVWTVGTTPGEYTVTATILRTAIAPVVFRARINRPFAVSSIAAGGTSTCAVASTGGTYCWGLYLSDELLPVDTASLIANAPPLVSLAVGQAFACGLTSAGAARCWGSNASGQLGIGTLSDFQTQALAPSGGLLFTTIVAGDAFACGLTTDHVVYCWGDNTLGQLGDSTVAARAVPAPVATTEHFTTIAAGFQHVCASATTGTTYCWGANDGGQLGAPSTNTCQVPVYDYAFYGSSTVAVNCATAPIAVKNAPGGFTALTASNGTCGLVGSGQAYCWGYGSTGGAGIPNNGQFTSLAAGYAAVCGITTALSISCWTYADPLVSPSVLTSVPGIASPRSIVAGHQHWCAIDGAGIAFCWGDNSYGQLGNGTRAAPAKLLPVAAP
jgi:Regulator of chromosome condensation (RCC1) repeat